jgi:hypothetical protein
VGEFISSTALDCPAPECLDEVRVSQTRYGENDHLLAPFLRSEPHSGWRLVKQIPSRGATLFAGCRRLSLVKVVNKMRGATRPRRRYPCADDLAALSEPRLWDQVPDGDPLDVKALSEPGWIGRT